MITFTRSNMRDMALKVGDRVDFLGRSLSYKTPLHIKLWNKFYYTFISRFVWADRKYKIMAWYQVHTQGYANREVYDFYSYHSDYVTLRLKEFKKYANSHPSDLVSIEAWHKIIDEIIWAFEFTKKDIWDYIPDETIDHTYIVHSIINDEITIEPAQNLSPIINKATELYEKDKVRYLEGMKLFAIHYNSLWD